ncbi:hypothetical protein HZU72_17800 [Halomonas sp. QX-2]|uniref:Large polyvalent protein associated domain-containing protein n=1 Tax=Vreelandella sedimenti TaxID=2729618 RepID=A0A7Z0NA52_9GAMM|nr:LPD38 domain-containing protein [Halomonas sedimenti]NYT74268.1 hypothetical protein [Halomonas sedimenti]
MNAAENRTPPKWTDIANDPDFQAADWQTKQRVRGEFYRRAIEPEVPESLRADVQSQFFTRTEVDVFGEREKQASADETQPDTPNLASNALRNAGERGLDLVGNAIQFAGNVAEKGEQRITEALGGINPGVIGGSAEEMRSRGYEPDVELGGYGLDFTMRAKPEDTRTGLIDTGQSVEDLTLGYQPNYTIDRALDKPSIKTIAGAAAEQGPAALADMAGLVVSLPAYLAARTQEIGEGRVRNDGREGMPEGRDYAVSGPTAAASVLLDRFALGRLLPGGKNAVTSARQIPGAVGRAAGTEGLTEAIQEGGIEYAGESVGTEAGWDPVTAGRRAAGGVIVGAPTGGAVRGATAAMEMRGNNQKASEQSEPSDAPAEQSSPDPQEVPSPGAETANVEAIGTAAELIAKPRFELSSVEREVRDSISYGDAFKALRAAAEERGDSDAVAELDAVSGEVSAALEAETMARTRNDSEAFTPIREQLKSASERFTRVMDRLNTPEANSEVSPSTANEEGDAQWEEAWREQAAEDGIADYDPNANLPDTTIDIDGQQAADSELSSPAAPGIPRQDEQSDEALQSAPPQASTEPALAPDQPSVDPDTKTPRRVPVESIQVDPQAYQFRTEVNEQGVDNRLEGVQKWDDIRAGNLILHERTDGTLYAADGHHRINLARQLEQSDVNAIVLREADGVTVEDARREAAEANIAAGSATAIDAAKVFRNSEGDTDTIIHDSNLPRTRLVRDGANIAKLDTESFGAVLNKVITEKDGAVIGRSFSDPDQQLAAVSVFQRVKPTNDNQRELLANEVRQAGFTESQGGQGGLFGDDPAESLIGERVKVMDSLRQTLVRDRRLFATLNDNAQTAEQAGNRIAEDSNNALQETSAEAIALLERATTTPVINQQINDAARRVKDGETLASVTRELKETLLNGTDSTAASEGRTPAPSSGQVDQTGQDAGRSEPVPAVNDTRTARAREQRSRPGAGAQAEPALTLKSDGSPFQTRRAVELSKRFRDTPNAQPVEVDGGWGFAVQDATQEPADIAAAEPETLLETQTEESLAQREQQVQQAEQTEADQRREQEQRAQADRDADDFVLSGSNRPNDIAESRGQNDIFDSQPAPPVASTSARKPRNELTPRQMRVSEAFGGAVAGDTINLLTDVGYSKAGNAYVIDSINKDGTLQATNVERGSSVLISQGDWTLATRRTKAPISDVVRKADQDDARYSMATESAAVSQAPRVADITAALKGKPEFADTRVIQSATELPSDALMGMVLRGINPTDVRGMFVGGELYVVADNMSSVDEAVRTAMHESVGHKGMRGVLGAELEPLMLEVYKSHTRSQAGRDNIAAIQAAYPFIDVTTHKGKVTLAEELVAHYIEDSNGSPTLSQRIKSTVRRLLRKLFPNIEWRTNDILALGEQSRRWLRRQQAQRDLSWQDETLYSLMEQQSSITHRELSKQLRDEYPGLKLDMAGRGQRVTISRIVSPAQNEGTGSEVMRRLAHWADASGKTLALTPSADFGGNVNRLREFYKRFGFIENKGRNKDYEISETMYREPDHGVGEQRFSLSAPPGTIGGKFSNTDSTKFAMPDEALADTAIRKMADKMRPLKILEDAIRRSGRTVEEEADAYLAEELFHGKAEYDLRQLREQYVEPLAEGLANYKISQSELDDYLYARHAPERNATIAERNPDKPDMQDGGSGMTNARAAEIIDKVTKSGKQAEYDRLAKIVYDMTRLRRDAIREGGLEDDTVVDAWEASWQYYVPLKGNAADEPGRPKTGRGFEVSGRESRTAAGRKSIADSPSSQVIVDANESLIRRRKNEVAQSLLSLVTDHPNPSLWEVFTDSNPDTQRTPVTITDPDTGKSRIEVQERPVNMTGNDKYFKVKRAGRTYYLKIHDERLMNAMRNVGPENNGLLIRMASTATRAMSAMMTSYNPEFMLTNFTRDVQTALLNLTAEQTRDDGKIKGEAIVRQTARDIGPAMKAAWRGLQNKPSKNDSGREWDTWFKEFQEDGAKTGYFDMKDISSQAKEIQSMVRRSDGTTMSHMLKARKKTADFVENMNGAVENAVRLSAYANARRAGVSRKQAASLAKNMTVNFNRRGEAGTALNAAYMFANASIQGTMNFARTMVTAKNTPDGKSPMNVWARANMAQKLAFGMASGAFALGLLNRWASEEDEDGVLFYDKVPDYVKERNIVIMSSLWGGEPDDFVSIPLPYGYNVFSVIGTHAEAVTAGTLDAAEAAKNLGLAILGSFSPIGWEDSDSATGLLMKNLTPTLVRSFAQVGFNEDFAGRLIYKDDLPFGTPTPESSRAMPSTPEPYKAIASFLNNVTGGSEYRTGSVDINPDVMQHLVNYYGGGAWGFVEKTSSFAARVATGEEIERYRIPFVGRFASSTSPYRDQGLFYDRRDELGQIANEADALKGRERIDFRRDNIEQIRLFNRAKNIEKQLQEDRKRRDRIQETETLSDEAKKNRIELIEKQMKRRVDDFNRRYNEL